LPIQACKALRRLWACNLVACSPTMALIVSHPPLECARSSIARRDKTGRPTQLPTAGLLRFVDYMDEHNVWPAVDGDASHDLHHLCTTRSGVRVGNNKRYLLASTLSIFAHYTPQLGFQTYKTVLHPLFNVKPNLRDLLELTSLASRPTTSTNRPACGIHGEQT
jgi:hypothetical protein